MRHNEVRDITASLLSEVCHGVTTEPHLQSLSGEIMSHRTAITNGQMVLIWILLFMVSGEAGLRKHFWMSGCSTLALNRIGTVL